MPAKIPINMFLRLSMRSYTRRHTLRPLQCSTLFAKSLDVVPRLSSQINNGRHRQLLLQTPAALPEASSSGPPRGSRAPGCTDFVELRNRCRTEDIERRMIKRYSPIMG